MTDRPSVRTRGQRGNGMGGHSLPVDGDSVEWYTPPGIFDALGIRFDLDPCSPPGGLPWVPAALSYSEADDGLTRPWTGRVWMNPPYGRHTEAWMRRLASHGDGIALVFARTETEWFHATIASASAVCFVRGRLTFVTEDRLPGPFNSGAPSMLVAYGEECADAVVGSDLGLIFRCRRSPLLGQPSLWEAT